MNAKHIFLLAAFATLAFSGPAQAQWQWLDDTGRKVFSDRPPPPGVPEKKVLHRPAGAAAPTKMASNTAQPGDSAAHPATTTASTTAASDSAKPDSADPELEKKKAEQEAEQARQKQATEQKQAQQRQANCDQARRARGALQTGEMLSHTNSKGERGFMSEETRKQEVARANQIIGSDCRS